MKKENFDISIVPKNGYLIFPLSMSRLVNAQSGPVIYEFLKFFESKIKVISLDVIFLYTNDLYLNSDDKALEIRKKALNQMLGHNGEFLKLLLKERKYVPQAFHFLSWDYAILNAENFQEAKNNLLDAKNKDSRFQKFLLNDLKKAGREETEANINFLIEEIAVTHLLAQKEIPLPHTLATPDGWRLICYPGDPIQSLIYTYKNSLLRKRGDLSEQHLLFVRSFYNMDKKILIDFDITDLEEVN